MSLKHSNIILDLKKNNGTMPWGSKWRDRMQSMYTMLLMLVSKNKTKQKEKGEIPSYGHHWLLTSCYFCEFYKLFKVSNYDFLSLRKVVSPFFSVTGRYGHYTGTHWSSGLSFLTPLSGERKLQGSERSKSRVLVLHGTAGGCGLAAWMVMGHE